MRLFDRSRDPPRDAIWTDDFCHSMTVRLVFGCASRDCAGLKRLPVDSVSILDPEILRAAKRPPLVASLPEHDERIANLDLGVHYAIVWAALAHPFSSIERRCQER